MGWTVFLYAAWNGNLPIVQHLTGLGADLEATDRVSAIPTVCVCGGGVCNSLLLSRSVLATCHL